MIRTLTEADLGAAHALTVLLGWPHRRADWAVMAALGDGFAVERDGALAGTAMAWRFGADRGTVGMIAVYPAWRGRGLGRHLMRALMDRLDGRSVALHATPAGAPLYHAFGFQDVGLAVQHQGMEIRIDPAEPPPGLSLRPIEPADLPMLVRLDQAAGGANRDRLIATLTAGSKGVALIGQAGMAGFALRRPFGRGQVIGPVIAPDAPGARAMIAALLASRTARFMRIDVPEASGLSPWLADAGLVAVDTVRRMVRGDSPVAQHPVSVYALASQAYG